MNGIGKQDSDATLKYIRPRIKRSKGRRAHLTVGTGSLPVVRKQKAEAQFIGRHQTFGRVRLAARSGHPVIEQREEVIHADDLSLIIGLPVIEHQKEVGHFRASVMVEVAEGPSVVGGG